MDNQIGKIVRSYELEGLVGTGGFGAVYRARQASVAREVAIKIIWPAFANQPNFIRRFEAEAQLVAGLEHPHIVPVYDYWRDPEGAYIVMRYLRGGHLREMSKGRPLPLREVAHILEQLATALALAHRYGVVHRDIKPENILLDEQGNAYLADFGIAQILSSARSDDDFMGMGSPAYAAPEQMMGGLVSSQSDIFSLGVVLFELLTGEHPYPHLEDLSMTQLLRVRTTEALPPLVSRRAELPRALNDVIQRATALDPKMRYPDALSLNYAFREALGTTASATASRSKTLGHELLPNPYRGLRAFQESDAALFYGRESLVRRLLNRLWENEPYARFLAIVGPSGSGKSSAVQAGLVPALRQGALPNSENWFYAEFVPGNEPMKELANLINSLAVSPPDNLLERLLTDEHAFGDLLMSVMPDHQSDVFVLIDQFEEVFTLAADDKSAERFIHSLFWALTSENSRLRLVVTIRADFYDRPLLTPRIADLVRERTEVVVPLSLAELERVIVEPARNVGVQFDSALVSSIVAEVQEQPGALPLLQYALTELFEKREGDRITAQAYALIGGVRGALARRADEIFAHLDAAHQEAMRQLFLRLITLGEGTEDTRRRALLSEIIHVNDQTSSDYVAVMNSVVTTLGQARLLTFDRDPITRSPTVEVTHEAIIREWSRLRTWLEESRADVRLQRALHSLAQEWQSSGNDASFLLRGIRLQQYERWLQASSLGLTTHERTYLEASLAARAQLLHEESERAAREKRLEKRTFDQLRFIIAGLIVLVGGAVALTAFALNERQRAEAAAQVADENATLSRSIALASNAQTRLANHDGDLALVLALEANAVPNPPTEARSTLAQVVLARGTAKRFTDSQAAVTGTAISADGTRIAASSTDANVRVWDSASGELIHTLSGHGGDVSSVAFSSDGAALVSASADFTAIVWNMADGTLRLRLEGHSGPLTQAVFTPDDTRILTASNDGRVIVWDATSGERLNEFVEHGASVIALDIAADGEQVLSGSRDGRVLVWRLDGGEIIADLSASEGALNELDISADGQQALIAKSSSGIVLWDIASAAPLRSFVGAGQETRSIAFTPDGHYVIGGTLDGEVQVWSADSGLLEDRLLGHRGEVLSVAVSADGRHAVSGSLDTTVRLWNISTAGLQAVQQAHTGRITELVTAASGQQYSVGVDGLLQIERDDATVLRSFTFTDLPLLSLAVRADEQQALIGGRDGILNLIDLTNGTVIASLDGHTGNVLQTAFLSDGTQALSSSQNGELILWNLADQLEVRRFDTGDRGAIYGFAVFADDSRVAVGAGDNTLQVFDITSGQRLLQLDGHSGSIYSVAVSPHGSTLVSAARDGLVIVWDAVSGAQQARVLLDGSAIWTVAFSTAGDAFAAGSANGMLAVYDSATGDNLQTYQAAETVFALAFNRADTALVSGHDSGLLADWIVFDGGSAAAWARTHRYIRELTCFERESYRVGSCDS